MNRKGRWSRLGFASAPVRREATTIDCLDFIFLIFPSSLRHTTFGPTCGQRRAVSLAAPLRLASVPLPASPLDAHDRRPPPQSLSPLHDGPSSPCSGVNQPHLLPNPSRNPSSSPQTTSSTRSLTPPFRTSATAQSGSSNSRSAPYPSSDMASASDPPSIVPIAAGRRIRTRRGGRRGEKNTPSTASG